MSCWLLRRETRHLPARWLVLRLWLVHPPQVGARLSALAGASIRDCYGADRLYQRGKQVDCTTGPLSAPGSPSDK